MIVEQTYNLLKRKYGYGFETLLISDVTIGLHLTAVRLSDKSIGTSTTLADTLPFCAKVNRDFGDFTPLRFKGQKAKDLLETGKISATISSVKMAVLNAISSTIISSGSYSIIENCDPIQLLDLGSGKTITIVGAFQSYIRKVSSTGNKLYVLEMNENSMAPEHRQFFIPADDYKKILRVSDIVIITGQTLVNKTIDDLLSAIFPKAKVVITGPSSGIIPDILFENRVSIVGTMRITNPDIVFDIVSEGGTGFHLFEYCAEKICILNDGGSQT
ncbi:MAG TPA: hypothetical protein DEO60_09485 [Bacteroidales bacterium]|nr:hypothetical protein [Bacteroidales bacterium]HBZ21350.1 hypothetical protein [Bacteroidales bacterium]